MDCNKHNSTSVLSIMVLQPLLCVARLPPPSLHKFVLTENIQTSDGDISSFLIDELVNDDNGTSENVKLVKLVMEEVEDPLVLTNKSSKNMVTYTPILERMVKAYLQKLKEGGGLKQK